jgi:hypothetical protein
MRNIAIWSAISQEVRSGILSQEALESLQRAIEEEQEILTVEEARQLGLILVDASLS